MDHPPDMAGPASGDYWLVRFLFHRGLALIYLLAFLVAARQFRPLAGEDGLLPIENYVERRSYRERPSLFYLLPDDRLVEATVWLGAAGSGLALVGLPDGSAIPASMLRWAGIWVLYLSFVNAGQVSTGTDGSRCCWRRASRARDPPRSSGSSAGCSFPTCSVRA